MRRILIVAAVAIIVIVSFVWWNREPGSVTGESSAGVPEGRSRDPRGPAEASNRGQPRGADSEPLDPDADDNAELARLMLASSIHEIFPDSNLSSGQIERLAASTLRLREAQTRLEALPKDVATSGQRLALSDEIEAAIAEMAEVIETNLTGPDPDAGDRQSQEDEYDSLD